jgi:hypothetical protein
VRFALVATALALAGLGCEQPKTLAGPGGEAPGVAAHGTPKETFDAQVAPILSSACASCHEGQGADIDGPNFLGGAKSSYYSSITSRPQFMTEPGSSLLLLKGEHTGPAFSDSQASTVASWLAQEQGGGSSGSAPGGSSGEAAIAAFGDCMTLEDWIETGMYRVGTQSTQQGPCMSCHQTGTGGTFIMGYDEDLDPYEDEDVLESFETNREMWYILKLALWTVHDDGTFDDIVPAHRWRDKGDEPGQHPSYEMIPEFEQALDDWFDATYARWSSGSCTP